MHASRLRGEEVGVFYHRSGHEATGECGGLLLRTFPDLPLVDQDIVDASLREHTDLEVLASVKEREEQGREWLRDEFEWRFGAEEPDRGQD